MPETVSSIEKQIVRGFLNALDITVEGVVKTDSFNPDTEPDGKGAVTVEITKKEQANPGLPDWFLSVSVIGMTFATEDPDKEIVRTLFGDVCRSVRSWKPSILSGFLSGDFNVNVAGILPVTNAAIREGADRFMFTCDFKIAVTDLVF